jgi:hypothetical protein
MFDFNKKYSSNLSQQEYLDLALNLFSVSIVSTQTSLSCPNIETAKARLLENPETFRQLLEHFHLPLEIPNFVQEPLFRDMYETSRQQFLKVTNEFAPKIKDVLCTLAQGSSTCPNIEDVKKYLQEHPETIEPSLKKMHIPMEASEFTQTHLFRSMIELAAKDLPLGTSQ